MTWEQIGAGIVAVVVFAWPKLVAVVKVLLDKVASFRAAPAVAVVPHPVGGPVGYEAAIHNLALVRSRLNATDHLGDEKSPERAAIDTLTLALVAGSDK
jgi:hypothetical protein